jgi:hypothetical protein
MAAREAAADEGPLAQKLNLAVNSIDYNQVTVQAEYLTIQNHRPTRFLTEIIYVPRNISFICTTIF